MVTSRKLCSILFCFIFAVSFMAAENMSLQSVTEGLALHKNTTGSFTQIKTITSAKGKRELKSYGSFIFSLNGIMWKTEKPFPSTMIVKADSITQISSDGKKQVTDASGNEVFASVASTLTAVFSNDVDKLQQLFKVSFSAVSDNEWQITLVPKDSTVAAVLGSIAMNGAVVKTAGSSKSETVLNSIVMTESDDSSIKYIFENQSYPESISFDE